MNICRKALACIAVLALSLILLSFTCAASENIGDPITLNINNKLVGGAMLADNIAYAPFRFVVGAIDANAEFSWDNGLRASVSSGNGVEIIAYSGRNYIEANGRIIYTGDVYNLNIDGVLYVPVRSVARAYSLNCSWNGKTMTAVAAGTPTPIMSGSEFYGEEDLYWLSRIISAESRGEPFEGQIAVGNVVLSRAEDGSFPNTVYGVIFDRKFGTQFSPVSSGSIYKNPTESSVLAAKIALEGYEVVDALYFCTKKVSPGSWIARTREYKATIGNHVFYY